METTGAKESRWNNEAHGHLAGALVEALAEAGSSTAKHKDLIVASMEARGMDFTWEAIRITLGPGSSFLLPRTSYPPLSTNQSPHSTFSITPSCFSFIYLRLSFCQPAYHHTTMAPGGGIRKWDEHAERDLLLALYTSTQTVIDKDIQANVVQMMQAKGHEINWDSLR
ncbi:hypothetical protein B0H63DRAFT_521090 [Podospora didyma]|uniref:Uncharacterized protein n=1 Tax=Podospora didyma TaxID=330526 RepID=A0AAE0NSS7_9PEZI|nr:hypothetical protein B0H63DRAFT_521090 [Podospora didyma]